MEARWARRLCGLVATQTQRCCWVYDMPGLFGYERALAWQRSLRQDRIVAARKKASLPDVLILLEHPPVYTLGANSSMAHLKFDWDDPPCEVHRVERGGEVTYHGPGQLVGYPIVNLTHYRKDLRWYLQALEEIVIATCRQFDIDAHTEPGLTGVWCGKEKIAAVGVSASRWITMHGFALNVNPCMKAFDQIVPCGINDRGVTSMAQRSGEVVLQNVRDEVLRQFATKFATRMIRAEGCLKR